MAKIIIAAFVCVVYASIAKGLVDETLITDEFRGVINNIREKCVNEVGVQDDVIENTNNGEFPDDNNLKCYMKCVLTNSGAMGEDGTLDFTAVQNNVPEGLREGIQNKFTQCGPQATQEDLCERAFQFYSCSYKVNPADYFLY